ncbi:MAG: T9SS type A sorting domain-containing protein [Flavobacteriales bacterium]|nr:T9SS type A sorting domain-containing protein [Flavobacteriales bacterium]
MNWKAIILGLALATIGNIGHLAAQTATNNCGFNAGNQYAVSVGNTCSWQTFNKPTAFTRDLIATGCSAGDYDDAWGWFTAVNTLTTITFDPANNHRPIMHVYTGACGSLTQVGCVNGGSNGTNAVLTLTTVIGTNYMIRIQRHNTNEVMNGTLCILSPQTTNNCALAAVNEYQVTDACTFQSFQKPTEYTASMNPGGCNSGNFDDAWGWFTATGYSTVMTFDPDLSHRPILHVFTGSCGSLTQVACNDGGANGVNASVNIATTPGTNYYFRVQRQGTNDAMDGGICIWNLNSTNTCALAPGNEFPVSSTCTFRPFQKPASYTASMNPGGCTSSNNSDAWGWFTATSTTTVITYDPDLTLRPILHVFTGTCGSLTQVGCHNGGATGANAELVLTTVIGQNYLFRIQQHGNSNEMNGGICIWNPNTTDVCAFAANNQFNVTADCSYQPFDFPTAYTPSMNPGGCTSGNYDDAWGWFTATSTTTVLNFDPDLSHRPIVHVFSGACGSLTQIGCVNSGAAGTNAELVFTTVIGQNYMFRVQQHNNSQGMFGGVCIRTTPPFDSCTQSTGLPVTENCFMQNFSNALATYSPETPNPNCGGTINSTTLNDVWFHFTAPASGVVIIETSAGTLNNAVMQLYSGTCGALTLVECNDSGMGGNMPKIDRRCNPLTPFATYRLRVWGRNGIRGSFNLCVRGFDIFPIPQEDCVGNNTVCNDQVIRNTTNWLGCTQDLNSSNRGCLNSNERQGTWYSFSPQETGTIGMLITPVDANGNFTQVDYDFAIWGPMNTITCPPSGAPIRCTYAHPPSAGTWLTGMAAGNSDNSEASSGTNVNGFVAPLTITASNIGQMYVLYVDNFTADGQNFNLDWTLSSPGILNCVVLPVELVEFGATARTRTVDVTWASQTESGSSHFIVERSADGTHFEPIGLVPAAGWSQTRINYDFVDEQPIIGLNYYRLQRVDLDGTTAHSEVATAAFIRSTSDLVLFPNPTTDRLQVMLEAAWGEVGHVLMLDASGRQVMQLPAAQVYRDGTLHLDVQNLDAGSYFLSLHDGSGFPLANGRFLKQ